MSIILLVVVALISDNPKQSLTSAFTDPFFLSCLGYMVVQSLGILYTSDADQNLRESSIKAGILALPFFFSASNGKVWVNKVRLISVFSAALVLATLYCLYHAYQVYSTDHNISVFFYHTLLNPLHEHAVYYSFYLLFCIIYWMEEGFRHYKTGLKKLFIILLLLYFLFIIILLASKMALVMLLLYLIYFLIGNTIRQKNTISTTAVLLGLAAILAILVTTKNPVKNRFMDLATGTSTLFKQDTFSPDVYFNGLQFRLLTWRFTYEILTEQKAWITGVSSGDGQRYLHEKYVGANMYLGKDVTRQGYMIYDCHNIFLQTTLESGLIGLSLLLSTIVSLFFKLAKNKTKTAIIFLLFMLAFGFTESYLSRQFGIVLFCFFPLFASLANNTKASW